MRTREQIAQAAVPFPDSLIEQIPKGHGSEDYVAWYHYAQRLLTQIGAYSWTVVALTPTGDEWVCIGRLTFAPDESYDGVGEGAEPKHAESDAFKRAASKAGFGLHLWAGKDYWLEKSLRGRDVPRGSVSEPHDG
jgi:hypothetical protein